LKIVTVGLNLSLCTVGWDFTGYCDHFTNIYLHCYYGPDGVGLGGLCSAAAAAAAPVDINKDAD